MFITIALRINMLAIVILAVNYPYKLDIDRVRGYTRIIIFKSVRGYTRIIIFKSLQGSYLHGENSEYNYIVSDLSLDGNCSIIIGVIVGHS